MNGIVFAVIFTFVVTFIASVFTTSFLLRVAKYTCIVFVPIGFLMWIYEGIKKNSFIPPENLTIIFLAMILIETILAFLLTKIYKNRVIEETYTQNLNRDSQRNFNYILIIIIASGNFLGIGTLLDLFGVTIF